MRTFLLQVFCVLMLGSLATCHLTGETDDTSGAPSLEERIEQAAEDIAVERSAEEEWLDDRLFALGTGLEGKIGIAVYDPARSRMMHYNGTQL
ncbi:MAG: hypothetical protein ABF298_05620, partial [Alteriqipengyuania sp.]